MGAWQWLCRAEGQTSAYPANPLCPSQCVERPRALTQPAQSPARDTQEPLTLSQATLTALHSLCQPFPCLRALAGVVPSIWTLLLQVLLWLYSLQLDAQLTSGPHPSTQPWHHP